MKTNSGLLCIALLIVAGCKHPLAIIGAGDIVETLQFHRGCTLEEFESGASRCTENIIENEPYMVSYKAIPRPGWRFVEWQGSACESISTEGHCEYSLTQEDVDTFNAVFPDFTWDATTAVFEEVQPGLHLDQLIDVDGVEREYHLYIPQAFENAPVVMLFHGHTGSSDSFIGVDGSVAPFRVWLEIAERENIIVAVPNGLVDEAEGTKGWNDCRAEAVGNSTADDVAFASQLIDHIVSTYRANRHRVYATGHSNGGHFSIRLGLELPQKLAAFAASAGQDSANSECADSDEPISALFISGTADPLLPHEGGAMAAGRGLVDSAEQTVQTWIARNNGNTQGAVTSYPDINTSDGSTGTIALYKGNANKYETALLTIDNGGHMPPSIVERYPAPLLTILGPQNADVEMAEEVWKFFEYKQRNSETRRSPFLVKLRWRWSRAYSSCRTRRPTAWCK